MLEWVKCSERLPEIKSDGESVEVLLWFGDHVESGSIYVDPDTGERSHVLYDGDMMRKEPTHWAYFNLPEGECSK